jgi:mannose/fructose/N-acetylgalactosamine-specific phosphotransferase system component IID
MYLVAIAWMYVVLMMAVAEAMSPQGTVLGAVVTLLLYGVGPLALLLYILGTPHRRRRRQAQDAAALGPAAVVESGAAPDGGGEAPGDAVAPVGKEP